MKDLLAVTGLTMLLANAANAKPPSDWVRCDGLAQPESIVKSLGRLVAVSSTFGLFGMPERASPQKRAAGPDGVAACTIVLADPVLGDAYWVRRINLLRARAVHNLEAGNADAALADLASIDGVAGPRSADVFYARSYGAGNALLTGFGQASRGDFAAAAIQAEKAATMRPWTLSVQTIAAVLLASDHVASPGELALADQLVRLDPGTRGNRADRRAEAGDWKGALADWDAAPKQPAIGENLVRLGVMAYAAAMTGDAPHAALLMDQMRTVADGVTKMLDANAAIAAAQTASTNANADPAKPSSAAISADYSAYATKLRDRLNAQVAGSEALVKARLALNAGKADAAATILADVAKLEPTPETLRLIDAVMTAQSPAGRNGAAAQKLIASRTNTATMLAAVPAIRFAALFDALPAPEDAATLNSYSGQWGLGLKSTGFKVTQAKPPATHTTIQFVGDVSSRGAVEEMTLLRAADSAVAAGKPGFIIIARRDYQRYSQMTYGGSPIGERSPAGYQSELDVEFVDPANAEDRYIAAADVQAALAPLYVKAKS